jgi:hypothetical protein
VDFFIRECRACFNDEQEEGEEEEDADEEDEEDTKEEEDDELQLSNLTEDRAMEMAIANNKLNDLG